MAYEINYEDKRFQDVEAQKQQALTKNEQTYAGMIDQSDKFYQSQINAVSDYEQKQTQMQQEQTDFTIEQIEQQKDQAKRDYTKEQSGAYTDWQKQSNQYGANAEQMAASGLTNTGYSESSQVSMYNTYQNRVATARESYQQTVRDYNDAITQARLQNNSVLAEIAYNSLQQRLELGLEGFQYKNSLILDQASKATEIDNTYYGRYQDVLAQINTENALAEQVRQFNANLAEEQRQANQDYALALKQLEGENIEKDGATTLKDEMVETIFGEGKTTNASGTVGRDVFINTYENSIVKGENPTEFDATFYGTFKNSYQPKGISGHGTLEKTKDSIYVKKVTSSGKVVQKKQNVWRAEDGTRWYWSGADNMYLPFDRGEGLPIVNGDAVSVAW